MPTEDIGPFAFEYPSEWARRNLLVFDVPGDGDKTATMVVTREERPEAENLQAYAWRRLLDVRRVQPGRELVDTRHAEIAGRKAFRVFFRFQQSDEGMHQSIAFIDAGGLEVLVATMTGSRREDFERFEEALASVRLTEPPKGARASSPALPGSEPGANAYPAVPMPGARHGRA